MFLYSASPSEQMLSYAELVSSIQNLKMYQSQPHGKEAIGWLDLFLLCYERGYSNSQTSNRAQMMLSALSNILPALSHSCY